MALTKVPSNLDAAVSVTQSQSDNSTNVATTAYVDTAISNLSDSAPAALNTLNEIAAALGDNENYAATTTAAIADKLPLGGGTLTGVLTINNTNDAQLTLTSPSSWTGIGFNDSASAGVEYLWHNGTHGTFTFGGSGSSVANKKLHVDGGMTVGSTYDATAIDANSLKVQGTISSGAMTVSDSILVSYSGNDGAGRDAGLKIQNGGSDWGTYIRKASAAQYGMRIDSAGTLALAIYGSEGGSDLNFSVNGSDGSVLTTGGITAGAAGVTTQDHRVPAGAGYITYSPSNGASDTLTIRKYGTVQQLFDNDGVHFPSGKVGIGTSTLGTNNKLTLYHGDDTSYAALALQSDHTSTGNSNGSWLGIDQTSAMGLYVWNYEAAPIRFGTSAVERMRIDSSGNVGLGEQQHATADQRTIEGRVDIRMNQAGVNWTDGNYSEIWDSAGTPGSKFNDTMLHIDTNRNGGSTGGVVGIAFSPGWQGHQNWGIVATNKTGGGYSQGDLSFVSQLNDGSIHERMRLSGAGNISVGTTTSAKFEINHGRQTGALGLSTATAFKLSQATGAPAVGNIVQMSMGYGNNYSNIAIAAIRTSAAAYGTDDLVFATKSGTTDSAPTERMRINSSGIMTVARTPGFVAIIGSSQTIGAGVSGLSGNFWTTIHHNMGGHFSTTTGKFTAPVTGLYWFNVSLATGSGGAATTYFGAEIYHNTTRITTGWNEHTAGYQKTNASYQLYMTAGQTAHAGIETQVTMTLLGSSSANNRYCVFSGYLIG